MRASTAELLTGLRAAQARDLVVLPNDADSLAVAEAAAGKARDEGLRVAVIPTRASVQAIAALAVHDPDRRFEDDVVAMTAAAGHCRHGGVTVASREAVTMAGVCRAGDVLGIVDGDFAVIGDDLVEVAGIVLDRMLGSGGELVTLVTGADADQGLAEAVADRLRAVRPEVDRVAVRRRAAALPAAHRGRVSVVDLQSPLVKLVGDKTAKALDDQARHPHRRGPAAPLPAPLRTARRADRPVGPAGRRGGHGPGDESSAVGVHRMHNRPGCTASRSSVTDGTGTAAAHVLQQAQPGLAGRQAARAGGLFSGKVDVFRGNRQLVHPDYLLLDDADDVDARTSPAS